MFNPLQFMYGRGQYPPEMDEIARYDDQRRFFEKQIREKGSSEFCLISKKFVKQWKYFVDYYQDLTEQQRETKKKPDKINSDLILNVDEKLLRYRPEDHVYNSSIRLLENEWDYEFITKDHYQFLRDKYSAIEPQVRIGVFYENLGRKVIYPNLARYTLIYLSPETNTIQHIKAQVDQNQEIKSWIDLLIGTFKAEFKNKQFNNLRIWQPRHSNFPCNLLQQNLNLKKKVDGEIVLSHFLICNLKLKRDNCLIIDFELNDWQFSKLDQAQCLEQDANLLYERARYGCGQLICDFPQCKNNNGFEELGLGDDDIKGICEQQAEGEEINWELICYKKTVDEIQPLQQYNQTNDPIRILTKLSMNLNYFGASFVENYLKENGPYKINPKNPEIDTDLIKKIQQLPTSFKSITSFIANLFSQKDKNLEPLQNLYQLRALFIVLQFRKYFEQLIDERILKLLVNMIRRLDRKQKNQLTKWFLYLSATDIEETVKTIRKQINAELLRQQTSQSMPFLEIDDAQKVQGLFEFLSIIYKSNQSKQRIPQNEFIFDYMKQVYKQDADKEEFSQFKYFQDRQWKHYTFSFCQYPWSIPIEFRSKLLSLDCKVKQHDSLKRTMYRHYEFMGQIPYLSLKVERNNIIESTIKQLNQTHIPLKNPLKVQFQDEQGVDEGGPKREFFRLLMEKLVSPDYGMFVAKNNNTVLWFNPQSFEMPIYYSLIGKLLGLAIYNQVLLDVRFPTVLFKKLQNEKLKEEDLKELDMAMYAGFEFLREQDDNEIIKSLHLTFNATYEIWGQPYFDDLKPNGSQIFVTQENKKEYIKTYTDWYLNKLVAKQFELLASGFKSVVDGDGIKLFSGEELQCLIIGLPHFDLKELESSTKYDGYDEKSDYIKYFWNHIHSLSLDLQKRFLFFCTGTDRIPVGGLKSIKFIIQKHGEDTDQLPSAHTCYNVLLLPYYKKFEILKEKLKISLENAEGFGLM